MNWKQTSYMNKIWLDFDTLFTWFLLSVLYLRIILTWPSCFDDSVGITRKGEMEGFRNNNTRSLPVDRKGLCSNLPRMRLCYLSTKRVERGPLFESFITKVSSHTPSQNKVKWQLVKRVLQIFNSRESSSDL